MMIDGDPLGRLDRRHESPVWQRLMEIIGLTNELQAAFRRGEIPVAEFAQRIGSLDREKHYLTVQFEEWLVGSPLGEVSQQNSVRSV